MTLKAIIILIEMIFLHVFADYHLQGILSHMKQQQWWKRPVSEQRIEFGKSKYRNDYRAAMLAHSFEWSFVVMIPMLVTVVRKDYLLGYVVGYLFLCALNTVFHYCVDDAKANSHIINLLQDQRLHLAQIVISWAFWWGLLGWA